MSNYFKKQKQLSPLKPFPHLEVRLLPWVASPQEISTAVVDSGQGSLGHRVIFMGW